jgi:hypothetical protein
MRGAEKDPLYLSEKERSKQAVQRRWKRPRLACEA